MCQMYQKAEGRRQKGEKGRSRIQNSEFPRGEPEQNSKSKIQNPHVLLFHFLHHTIDSQVRRVATATPLPATQLPKDMPLREWLQALGKRRRVDTDGEKCDRLASALSTWMAPIQRQLTAKILPFRTCFTLETPPEGKTEWTLHYGLQAINDPDVVIGAQVIWDNPVETLEIESRTIDQPQETLLAGLGLASRLYSLIEQSLHEQQPTQVVLNAQQAYDFIQSISGLLQNNSFGVVLPPSLSNRDGVGQSIGIGCSCPNLPQ